MSVASDGSSTARSARAVLAIVACSLVGLFTLQTGAIFGQDCSCGYPCDVELGYQNIFGVESHAACLTIVAGPDLSIEAFADVTLTAGDLIVLKNGVSVSEGASLILSIDPQLFCDVTVDLDEDGSDACLDCDDLEASVHPGQGEVCDGLDNDCNGTPDDGNPGGGGGCDTGLEGVCAAGTVTCTAGALSCVQNVSPSAEVCDGLDNDCDSASADGSEDPQNGASCDGPDSDLCLEGTFSCAAGVLTCSDSTGNILDVCNGADDDCDPASADGSEDPQVGAPCDGSDSDLCLEGTSSCAAGVVTCSDSTGDDLDVCNGSDDDCDPASADGSEDPQVGAPCDGADSDLCLEGTSSCVAGVVTCSDSTGDDLDVCNGIDDDCDPASADGSEDPQVGVSCDGFDSDLCAEGTSSCAAGLVTCSDNTGDTLDVCNGADDDCDPASADGSEDPQVGAPCDGPDSDLCPEGTFSCAAGSLECSDSTGNILDICNGADDDCDPASADGSEDPLIGASCDTGQQGVCAAGTESCIAGALSCVQNVSPSAEVCDGLDNDCDGTPDDGNPGGGAACNTGLQGVCAAGTETCIAGSLSCVQDVSSSPEVCDGLDNDCDGLVDEDC